MMGMDCINQQTAQDRDCSHCIWHTDGRCASWDCEYISRKEALEAVEKVKAMESAQPDLSEAYAKAVWTWLLDYQIKASELEGRYTPYEVLSWVANDWRKEHERFDKQTGGD